MIIVRLNGGLGNQMFQYACGRAVSIHWNTAIALDHLFLEDKSYKPDFTYRDYALDAFAIDKKIDTKSLIRLGFVKAHISPLQAKISLKRILHGYTYYHEKGLQFKKELFSLGPNLYLSGYFQSEKYFKEVSAIIRNDFTFPPVQHEKNKMLLEKIQQSGNSVSLHIRRGDFITAGNGSVHYACTPEYYQEAISVIKGKVSNPHFFIFAQDDMEWARNNLKIDVPHEFIGDHNAGNMSFEDLRLISNCKHHIIANSSFSWWGAWLNPDLQKIVIAPKKWLLNKPDNPDLIPEDWIQL